MARNFVHDTFPTGLPVGRLVQGDCYEPSQKQDENGKGIVHPVGHANAGQPVMQYYLLVAYPKTDSAFLAFREFLAAEARLAWPQYHNATTGACLNPTFAHKVIDGDGQDKKGRKWSEREGFAGHWVVRYASTFAPKVMEWAADLGAWKETDKGRIKLGDYVKVSGSTQSNNSAASPGMHVNPGIIAFERDGERIVLGITADQALGAGPGGGAPSTGGATPPPPAPAAAAGPVRPTDPSHIGHAGTPNEVWWTGSAWIPAPTASTPPPPPAPSAPPAPPAPPAEPYTGFMETKVLLPAAGATTYAQYREAGWSDEQLIARGYMAAPAA